MHTPFVVMGAVAGTLEWNSPCEGFVLSGFVAADMLLMLGRLFRDLLIRRIELHSCKWSLLRKRRSWGLRAELLIRRSTL